MSRVSLKINDLASRCKKAPTTVPTKLVVAPMIVATLLTSSHLKIDTTAISATRPKPVMMIHNPYLIRIEST